MVHLEELEALLEAPPTKSVDDRGMSVWGITIEIDDAIDAFIRGDCDRAPKQTGIADRVSLAIVMIFIFAVLLGPTIVRALR